MTFQRIYTALALTMLFAAWITASLAHAKSGRAHDISNPSFQKCMRMARHPSTCRRLWQALRATRPVLSNELQCIVAEREPPPHRGRSFRPNSMHLFADLNVGRKQTRQPL
jgi:hypothetical protein